MKKVFFFAAVLMFLLQSVSLAAGCIGAEIGVSAKSAVLMNADTLEVLYAKAENEQRPMASTTKIMTALLALEYGQPQLKITASEEAVKVEGTSIGLLPGDEITLETLVYGMLLESGNDAANTAAEAVSGSIDGFCTLMNKRAKELGMKNTSFKNPSGLPAEGHYSTAADMALLASFAIKQPSFRKICSMKSARVCFGTPECARTFSNHNKLLSMYDGAIGLKTGFTKSSGRCLVSAAQRQGVTLVAVTLNAPDDWNDHIRLLDYGFSVSKSNTCRPDFSGLKVAVTGSDVHYVGICTECENIVIPENCETVFFTERFLYAPVKKGDAVGYGIVKHKNGTEVSRFTVVADSDAQQYTARMKNTAGKPSFLEKIKKYFKGLLSGK